MEVMLALPFVILPFLFPVITGLMAISFGRKFWPWFCIGLLLPFISMIILLFLPDLGKKEIKPVSDKEIFDPFYPIKKSKGHASHEVYFSAKA